MPQKLLRYNGKTYSFPEDTTDQEAFDFIDREEVAGAIQRGMETKAQPVSFAEAEERVNRALTAGAKPGESTDPFVEKMDAGAFMRYGLPTAASMMFPPSAAASGARAVIMELAKQAAVGGTAGGVGEAVAQTVNREQIRPGEIAGAAIRNAAPSIPGSSIGKFAANVGMAAGAGALGGAAEGRVSSAADAVREAAIAGSLPVAGEAVRGVVGAGSRVLGSMAERAQDIERIGTGVRATLGQTLPNLAAAEQRIRAKIGEIPTMLRDQYAAIEKALQLRFGAQEVPKGVVGERLGEALNVEEVVDLANKAERMKDAYDILNAARGTAEREVAQKAVKDASDEFQNLLRQSSLKASQTFQPNQAGVRWEQAAKDALGVFKAHSDKLYEPLNRLVEQPAFNPAKINPYLLQAVPPTSFADNPVFKTSTIASKALDAIKSYPTLQTGEIAKSFAPNLSMLRNIMDSRNPASLNQLRAIRDTLYDFADASGQAMHTKEQRALKGVAAEITDTINSQAKAAFGDKIGQSLLDANKFYSEFRPQFDFYGVREAFRTPEMSTGKMAVQAGQEAASFGLEAPRIQNLVGLIEGLNKAKIPGAPNPQPLFDDTRNYVVSRFRNPTTKAIDASGLEKALDAIEEASPGSLSKLGFGSIDDIRAASKFAQEASNALTKDGTQTLRKLLATSPGAAVLAIQSLKSLESQRKAMAKLSADALNNATARKGLDALRQRYAYDLLLELDGRANIPRMEAIERLSGVESSQQARTILGDAAVDTIIQDVLPGYQRIADYRTVAGNAGATVGGAAPERVAESVAKSASRAMGGNMVRAGASVLGEYMNLSMYYAASKLLAESIGASGLRSKARFMSVLDENIRKAQNPAGTAIQRAIRGEPEK
jgi:hypothetical protein